jgi:LacI family transcriptional regulator
VVDEHPGANTRQRKLQRAAYDGIIARAEPAIQRAAKRMGIPLVNTNYEHHRPGVATVRTDANLVGRLAADHLLGRGYPRFGVLSSGGGKSRLEIAAAFTKRVEEEGKQSQVVVLPDFEVSNAHEWANAENFLYDWLRSMIPPIALFIESTFVARVLVEMCHELNLRVPQQIAVLCFEDDRSMSEVSTQLSSIESNFYRVGYEAADLLERLMDGEPVPESSIPIPPKRVIARASTDYFAVEDELVAQALIYISQNLTSKLTTDEIAEGLAVSSRTLQLRFATVLGHGVGAEILRLRLGAAKVMLAEVNQPIGEIARKVGFTSSTVMGQAFTREFGMSPSAYRKQQIAQ